MRKQKTLLCNTIAFLFAWVVTYALPAATSSSGEPQPLEIEGVRYTKNKFGDIFPEWQSIGQVSFTQTLKNFSAAIQPTGAPIIITVPHLEGAILPSLVAANFKYMYGNEKESRWMIKHRAHIPEPYTAIAGGEVVVVNSKGEMLVIEEHTRRNRMSFPAGHVDPQEYARNAACRELREEVGLDVRPENLKLIALVNRIRANKDGASDYNHYYLAQTVDGSVNPDGREVLQACWVQASKLARGEKVNNLESNPIVKLLAQHITRGCRTSQRHVIPNYRRRETPSWAQNDPQDVMYVELFAQDITGVCSNYRPMVVTTVVVCGLFVYYHRAKVIALGKKVKERLCGQVLSCSEKPL